TSGSPVRAESSLASVVLPLPAQPNTTTRSTVSLCPGRLAMARNDAPMAALIAAAGRLMGCTCAAAAGQSGVTEDGEPVALTGGGQSAVHRQGDVVIRDAGPWTPAVHALLRHLEEAGFAGAPRLVGTGLDAGGRETLTF